MKILTIYPICVFFLFFIVSCSKSNKKANSIVVQSSTVQIEKNPFLEKYEGGYMIEVKGYASNSEAEMFVLHKNGVAQWMYVTLIDGKSNVASEKSGNWTATENKITITIKGNSGNIVEEYIKTSDQFNCVDRSLKKVR